MCKQWTVNANQLTTGLPIVGSANYAGIGQRHLKRKVSVLFKNEAIFKSESAASCRACSLLKYCWVGTSLLKINRPWYLFGNYLIEIMKTTFFFFRTPVIYNKKIGSCLIHVHNVNQGQNGDGKMVMVSVAFDIWQLWDWAILLSPHWLLLLVLVSRSPQCRQCHCFCSEMCALYRPNNTKNIFRFFRK